MTNKESIIAQLELLLNEDPLASKDVLLSLSKNQDKYIKAIDDQRNVNAYNSIVALMGMLTSTGKHLSLNNKKLMLKQVIEFHFPKGLQSYHSQTEKEFFKTFKLTNWRQS